MVCLTIVVSTTVSLWEHRHLFIQHQRPLKKLEIEFTLHLQVIKPLVLRSVDFGNLHVAFHRRKPPDELSAKCITQHLVGFQSRQSFRKRRRQLIAVILALTGRFQMVEQTVDACRHGSCQNHVRISRAGWQSVFDVGYVVRGLDATMRKLCVAVIYLFDGALTCNCV